MASRYQLLRRLATGGMAEVFLARMVGPGGFEKALVLKRILPQLAERPSFVTMFLNEARIAARFNHPNIVQVFDSGDDEGSSFIAMEYVDGLNLRALSAWAINTGKPVPCALAARVIAQACEGLAYAHEFVEPETGRPLGILHRDVSADNLMVTQAGVVKVLDFGIARAADEAHLTRTGTVKGKVAYMAVEQLRSEPLDHRADQYSLGVVLYLLLTGRKPYERPSEVGIITAILMEAPTPVRTHRPDVPQALAAIVERATARERGDRFPDCRALQAALEAFIASTGETVNGQHLARWVHQALGAGDAVKLNAATSRSGSSDEAVPLARPEPGGEALGIDWSEANRDPSPEPWVKPPLAVSDARPSLGAAVERALVHRPLAPAPSPVLDALGSLAAEDRSRHLLRRMAGPVGKLLATAPFDDLTRLEVVTALVDAALLADDHAVLVRLLGRPDEKGREPDLAGPVREVLGLPLRRAWLVERLRAGAPDAPGALEGWLVQLIRPSVDTWLDALTQLPDGPGQEVLCRALAAVLAADPTPLVERLERASSGPATALALTLELAAGPSAPRLFGALLARRNIPLVLQVMSGRARARGAESLTSLEAALGDRAEEVRIHALGLLAELDSPRATALVLTHVRAPSFEKRSEAERRAAWQALGATSAPEAWAALEAALAQRATLLNRRTAVEAKLAVVAALAAGRPARAQALLEKVAASRDAPEEVAAAARLALQPRPPGPPERLSLEQRAQARRALVLELALLGSALRVVDPEDRFLDAAFVRLREVVRTLVVHDGKLEVQLAAERVQINGTPVAMPLEPACARLLTAGRFQGLSLSSLGPLAELRRRLLAAFPGEAAGPLASAFRPGGPTPLPTRAPALERPEQLHEEAMVVLESQRERLQGGHPIQVTQLGLLIERWSRRCLSAAGPGLVAVLPAAKAPPRRWLHAANTAASSLAFAADLALGLPTLREVAWLALLWPLCTESDPQPRPGSAPPESVRLRLAALLLTQLGGPVGATCALAAIETGLDAARSGSRGPGVVGSVVALCEAWDSLAVGSGLGHERALVRLTADHKPRFAPELLTFFRRWALGQLERGPLLTASW